MFWSPFTRQPWYADNPRRGHPQRGLSSTGRQAVGFQTSWLASYISRRMAGTS
ncbi:hypothetical protein SAMN05421748_11888 [Paractinoplanes atraurantiacus]|uniref:Uncharacterized protein n=1 Tax=Paractinoplanes atraurantiacus TaxID=1036182 RepID=A0A285JAI4_9ACTN|nr:hypothetical protein SAMN05421748_11888 [Actinoplanes atraurantiacus]